jgi:hypothetical protein
MRGGGQRRHEGVGAPHARQVSPRGGPEGTHVLLVAEGALTPGTSGRAVVRVQGKGQAHFQPHHIPLVGAGDVGGPLGELQRRSGSDGGSPVRALSLATGRDVPLHIARVAGGHFDGCGEHSRGVVVSGGIQVQEGGGLVGGRGREGRHQGADAVPTQQLRVHQRDVAVHQLVMDGVGSALGGLVVTQPLVSHRPHRLQPHTTYDTPCQICCVQGRSSAHHDHSGHLVADLLCKRTGQPAETIEDIRNQCHISQIITFLCISSTAGRRTCRCVYVMIC